MTEVNTFYEIARVDLKSIIYDSILILLTAESVNNNATNNNAHDYKLQKAITTTPIEGDWVDIDATMQYNIENVRNQIVSMHTVGLSGTSRRYIRAVVRKDLNHASNFVQNIKLSVLPIRNIT